MDKIYMKMALELAQKGGGKVNPNPLVGAIILKEDRIIGQGYHEFYGGPHAEINAFNSVEEDTEGCTMYVTLEPCSHFGKTPPCVNEIIRRKIKRVVIGMMDPNPLVSGRGIRKLRENGIEVEVGVLEEECKKINEVFIKYVTTKEPFVIMKSAMTLDGKTASFTGNSKWITGEAARENVHKLRGQVSCIMVGIGTVIADNPMLTCRLKEGKNPIRVIVDSSLRIPLDCNVVKLGEDEKNLTIVATTERADKRKIEQLREHKIDVLVLPEKDKEVDLRFLMKELGKMGIDSVLLEGGATLNYSAITDGIVDKVQFYVAPKIIGGSCGKSPVGGKGIPLVDDAIKIYNMNTSFIGEDILIEAYVR